MAKDTSLKLVLDTLSAYGITKVGRHHRMLLEDEFRLKTPYGEPFPFLIIHDGTPARFVKDFNAFVESLTFNMEDEYERSVAEILKEARDGIGFHTGL